MMSRSGKHPDAVRTVVRLTEAALEDLERIHRKGDPQVVRWALKKLLLLEKNPNAGKELRGSLVGFRKLTVRNRDWHIIWRVTHEESGAIFLDVAEVWAFGARKDSEVYQEVQQRVARMKADPVTVPLAEALGALGKVAYGMEVTEEPGVQESIPDWLVHALVHVVKMPRAEVLRLSADQALQVWDGFISEPK